MAHVINHTCHPGFANCRFVHVGIVGGWSEDEQELQQGGIGGRSTSEVFVVYFLFLQEQIKDIIINETRGEQCRTVCELWNQVLVYWWVCVPFVSIARTIG